MERGKKLAGGRKVEKCHGDITSKLSKVNIISTFSSTYWKASNWREKVGKGRRNISSQVNNIISFFFNL